MTAETFDWTDPDTGEKHSCAIPDGLPMPPKSGETIADIVDELRTIQRNPTLQRTLEHAKELDLADRIEAAHQREKLRWAKANGDLARMLDLEKAQGGDAARLREALEKIVTWCDTGEGEEEYGCENCVHDREEMARAALAAPPRNCDRPEFKNGEDAWLAFEKENPDWCDNHQSKSFWCDDCESAGCDRCMADWLMSQATTEKGGAECQQK